MHQALNRYAKRFTTLNTDRSNPWGPETRHQAPHKPILLLAVLDTFAVGHLTANLVELTPELGELFDVYWSLVKPMGRERGNVATPFFHLRSEGFWHLQAKPGKETYVRHTGTIQSVTKLKANVFGAMLDEALYEILRLEEDREILRRVLVDTYFAPELRTPLLAQGLVNARAERYAEKLLTRASSDLQESGETYTAESDVDDEVETPVRDQGFRRAIVRAYDHRCALCGVRIRTPDGRSAIVAAHIIPWSESHDDDPRNGMALCQLCHWTFDEGLFAVNDDYIIRLSPQLAAETNMPGHLHTLGGRPLIGPRQQPLWPFPDSLRWHRARVFRR